MLFSDICVAESIPPAHNFLIYYGTQEQLPASMRSVVGSVFEELAITTIWVWEAHWIDFEPIGFGAHWILSPLDCK